MYVITQKKGLYLEIFQTSQHLSQDLVVCFKSAGFNSNTHNVSDRLLEHHWFGLEWAKNRYLCWPIWQKAIVVIENEAYASLPLLGPRSIYKALILVMWSALLLFTKSQFHVAACLVSRWKLPYSPLKFLSKKLWISEKWPPYVPSYASSFLHLQIAHIESLLATVLHLNHLINSITQPESLDLHPIHHMHVAHIGSPFLNSSN